MVCPGGGKIILRWSSKNQKDQHPKQDGFQSRRASSKVPKSNWYFGRVLSIRTSSKHPKKIDRKRPPWSGLIPLWFVREIYIKNSNCQLMNLSIKFIKPEKPSVLSFLPLATLETHYSRRETSPVHYRLLLPGITNNAPQ